MKADIQWWIDHLNESAYPVRVIKSSVLIKTDASRTGGGACDGRRTRGSWTAKEAMLHINCLELKEALFALQSLCMGYKHTHIRLLSDICTTVACINKFGSTNEKCNDVTREI